MAPKVLSNASRLAFWRRSPTVNTNDVVDVEAQLEVETKAADASVAVSEVSSSPTPPTQSTLTLPPSTPNSTTADVTADNSPRVVHFDEKANPPAYDSIVTRVSREVERDQPACTPITIQGTDANGQPPTILVMFKEDYEWARVYLKELDYKVALRRALRRHLYKWYALLIIAITLAVLVTTKHTTIVDFCKPVTEKIRRWPGGWLIPVALLVVVSFPPLVGHEIIGILCGLVWGLGEGFGILAAGTFAGELATWVVFKWMCTSRAAKIEKKNKLYAALTQLIREKSFTFVLILRFSAVPGHIVTAVSASAGANLGSYSAAAFLTLPKQLVLVYLGTSFGTHKKKDSVISGVVTALTFVATIIAAVYIYYQMRIIIRRGGASVLPIGDPRTSTSGADWADVQVHGAEGVGAGVRLEVEEGGHGRSVDVIFGPHARAAQHQLAHYGRPLVRTRSLPGPITEGEMRTWLTQIDTALLTTTTMPQIHLTPMDEKDAYPFEDESSRAQLGYLDPMPYSSTLLLSAPAISTTPATPEVQSLGLPDLAHEHMQPSPRNSLIPAPAHPHRPVSGTVPAILLTPTYTPARARSDSLRGTQSLDIERPKSFAGEDIPENTAAPAPNRRTRGESSAAWLDRP